jgi:2-hydroxy-3-oxopropionate reductase
VEARLHHKDTLIVLECAADGGVAVPGAALAAQSFSALMARGGARQDSSAVLTVVEAMACPRPTEPSDPRYRYDQKAQLDEPTREA